MTVIETPRLQLRPMRIDDLPVKYAIDIHPDVYRFQAFVRLPDGQKRARTLEETRGKLEQRIGEFALQGFGMWAMVLKENNTLIGWSGLQFYLLEYGDFSTPEIELFYAQSREYWGRGFVHEACQRLIEYGFKTLKLPRITSVVHRDNIHSLNVARRNGMHFVDHPTDRHNLVGILNNPHISPEQMQARTIK
ncbi:N-acetyltransferase [Dictyobacter sp. S3.2.2.5]|uniref:N-acetyltransferase n=1 Tax=Dictyobacter halimunensis TaxID=3026934 RepID=A0ABQ6FMJ6_9CHLR|nr:N-acetyltransferase [Dictyobacter sp. S3.2.2.5]